MKKEELLDKYIKYNSKITFDIFKLMYQKLIDLGFTNSYTVEGAFKEFSGNYPYFVMKLYENVPFFNQYTHNLIEQSEISVKDLLGYNPFESFILPEKWCIKVQEMKNTPEEIVNWRLKIVMCGTWETPGYLDNDGYHRTILIKEYTEITFEQFKQYVLKEPIITETSKTEKDWSKATEEELLKEAKRRYPIGCIFKCLVTGWDAVVKENIEFKYEGNCIYSYIDNSIYHKHYENNKWAEVVYLSESKVEESVPEYVECVDIQGGNPAGIELHKIYKVLSSMSCDCGTKLYLLDNVYTSNKYCSNCNSKLPLNSYGTSRFKPSTKEAFEAQHQPKSIEKWGKDSYVVCINNYGLYFKVGDIGKIEHVAPSITNYIDISKSVGKACLPFKSNCQWFATLTEAEEFAKTLVNPVNYDKGIFDAADVKQPLKQAVHCKTQEEWDFVTKKLGYKWTFGSFDEDTSWISLNSNQHSSENYWKKYGYQILSFQEWCDLNGYKMEKTRFKTGDYVVSLRPEYLSTLNIKYNYCYIQYKDGDKISVDSGATMYEDDINYARLATPEEIEEYKRIGKPYDVTTLQPSINAYGLNIGDKLDAIIIAAWEKKSFNYFSGSSEEWKVGNGLAYDYNRNIEGFKIIDGVVGFSISDTLGIYLRAEGFKEFAENYNKSKKSEVKFEINKWYKVCDGNSKIPHDDLYYVKSPKIVYNIIKVDQYLYNGCLGKEGNFGYVGDYTFVEVPLSEIQQYLPEGHPDLVTTGNKEVKDISKTFTIRVTSKEVKRINI